MNPARIASLVALLLALLPTPGFAKKGPPPEPRITPAAEQPLGVVLENGMLRARISGVTVQCRHLDEAARKEFYLLRSRLRGDPFPSRVQWEEGFTIFEVSFLNESGEQVQFQPGLANLVPGSDVWDRRAYDIGSLYSYFSQIFFGDEEKIQQALEVIYTGPVLLQPGQRISKLLVFEGVPNHMRRFLLAVGSLFVGSSPVELGFSYDVGKKPPSPPKEKKE